MFTYFIHPTSLSTMSNVLRMRMTEGAAGYGIYVMVLESLRASEDYRIKYDPAVIAWSIHESDQALLERVLTHYDLFEISSDNWLSSPWLTAAMAQHEERRAKLSAAGKRSAESKARKANEAATTLNGGGQPASNHVDTLSQQRKETKEIKEENLNQPTPYRGVAVDSYFDEKMISKIGKDKSGQADTGLMRAVLPKEDGHNPELLISRIQEYKLTKDQVLALYNVTDGCKIGGARTMALLAAFRHCKDTNFRPKYAYEWLMSRLKDVDPAEGELPLS